LRFSSWSFSARLLIRVIFEYATVYVLGDSMVDLRDGAAVSSAVYFLAEGFVVIWDYEGGTAGKKDYH
jgi:hypothetical protein